MRIVMPEIPIGSACRVVGEIADSDDPRDLSEDMLEVAFPNGALVSVGWFQDAGGKGAYHVFATLGLIDIMPTATAATADNAAEIVSQMVSSILRSKAQNDN